jgi:hypothetical protein
VAVKELLMFANNEDEDAKAWQDMQNEVWRKQAWPGRTCKMDEMRSEVCDFRGERRTNLPPSFWALQVSMLGSLSHPNIMRFMAISLDPPMIVMQYYSHGSLFALLQVRVLML